jgi:ABC-type glycerol-3-phosphate transport system substrate-binding protein
MAVVRQPTAESGPVELTFWHTMGQANQTVVRDMIANFKSITPKNIRH